MSCRKPRLEADGVGCSAAKAVKADKVEDEDDDDEDEWKEDKEEETDGGSLSAYRKNKWKLVAVWTNIDKQEALRRAAEIMTDDFQVAGKTPFLWSNQRNTCKVFIISSLTCRTEGSSHKSRRIEEKNLRIHPSIPTI